MRANALLPLLVALMLTLAPRVSHADDDPRKVRAEKVFKEGVKLHTEGKHEEALAKLREAYLIYPSPNTMTGIAKVEQSLGHKVDALHHYKEALKNPLLHPDNAEYAKKAIPELEAETAHVDVKGPPGLVVQIDGKDVALPLPEPIDTEPKTISLAGKAGDKEYVGSASCPAGRLTVIEMRVVQNDNGGGTTFPPNETRPSSWTTGKTLALVMWGGALVAGGAGAYFTIAANRAAGDLDDIRGRSSNPDGACVNASSPDCATRRDATDDRVSSSNLAVGMFIGAGALAVGGAVAFFMWPKRDTRSATTFTPIVTRDAWGVGFGREF